MNHRARDTVDAAKGGKIIIVDFLSKYIIWKKSGSFWGHCQGGTSLKIFLVDSWSDSLSIVYFSFSKSWILGRVEAKNRKQRYV